MKRLLIKKQGIYEYVSGKILYALTRNRDIGRIDYLKCRLGLEILLLNISKLLIIYLLAYLFDILWQTIVFHFFYMVVRLKGYGAHFKSSLVCTCISCVLFVGAPYIIVNYYIFNNAVLFVLYISGFCILLRYASMGTAKNPVKRDRQAIFKKMTLINYLISGLALMLIKSDLFINLAVLGLFSASILTLPILTKSYELDQQGFKNP